jgi:uncharacterized zinc-type alcohol dehydrogenase-like protein
MVEGTSTIPTKDIKAFGAAAAETPLKEMTIPRREVLPHDVEIQVLYCGKHLPQLAPA